jgi:hypothetical protein
MTNVRTNFYNEQNRFKHWMFIVLYNLNLKKINPITYIMKYFAGECHFASLPQFRFACPSMSTLYQILL